MENSEIRNQYGEMKVGILLTVGCELETQQGRLDGLRTEKQYGSSRKEAGRQ